MPLLVCASTQFWDETWFRKQHFMSRLSLRRPVLYIEPSRSILRPPSSATPPTLRNPLLQGRLRSVSEGLHVWTPPRGLPFWTHRAVSRAQYSAWGRLVRRIARRLGYERTWLWLYQPLWIGARASLAPERVIFDLVDDLAAYESAAHSRSTMARAVDATLESADLVFTTSKRLAESIRPRTRAERIEVVANGVREDWIDRPPSPIPPELLALPHPWIGFVGAIFAYLDYDLLRAVARAFPQASVVLVGPIHERARAEELAREPNVHLLGPRAQQDVPAFLEAFDLCLSPFKAGAVRRAVNPLKIYEYLACGRPVVSTPLESLAEEPIAPLLRFAEDAPAFIEAVRAVLAEEDDRGEQARVAARLARQRVRREAVRPYTWEALSARVESTLEAMEARW